MPLIQRDPVVGKIIGAAIEVHHLLGPGLMESAYQTCLLYELLQKGMRVDREVPVPVAYKGVRLECGYRLDFVVDGNIIVEVKSVAQILPIDTAQVLSYLRLTGARQALLVNFNELTLMKGLRSYLASGNGVPEVRLEG